MEVKKAIAERRSVRSYSDKPVDKAILEKLLDAGIWAPSAGNIQPWELFAITDATLIEKLRVVSPGMLADPQAIICICSNQKKAYEKARNLGKLYALMDCSMAAQNIMLRAYDVGLGTCVIRGFNAEAVRELLDAPDYFQPELLIIIGFPSSNPKPPSRNRDIIYWNRYNKEESNRG